MGEDCGRERIREGIEEGEGGGREGGEEVKGWKERVKSLFLGLFVSSF